jgi:hypothetical protein
MKTIWITALAKDTARVAAVGDQLKRYGLQSKGHFWVDDPAKMAWRVAYDALREARADAWLVLVDAAEMAKPSVRYGLSLLGAALSAQTPGFPVLLLWEAEPAEPPALLRDAANLSQNQAWPAKVVAKANLRAVPTALEYRFEVFGDERLGQWFEIAPTAGAWDGIVFGVAGEGAEIDFQAVGPHGGLPEKTVLEYAQQGLRIETGARVFNAWALRNRIDGDQVYYARVKGRPDAVLFMPYAEDSESEATILTLC